MRQDSFRNIVIGLIAFLTLVDLFATQAILPALVTHYGVSPAAMGLAVNASTFGMAVAGIAVSLFSRRIDRRKGVVLSLLLLSIPTALLSIAPDLAIFTTLRVVQGLLMSTAFTLTLAYLAENCSARASGSAFAAYITGNVASNLFGRLISAAVADHLGLSANFMLFAGLNLAGAALAFSSLRRTEPMPAADGMRFAPLEHLRNPALRVAFAIGFLILFAFIGTFTYVNFVLVQAPLAVSPMQIGLVYFVFLPSILTTPLAGRAVQLFGTRPTFWSALIVAALGLPLLLGATLAPILVGLALVGVGTFLAQAAATGFVGRAATGDRGAAGGLYLASYFLGGLVGSAVLSQVFDLFGWPACVLGIGLALGLAALLAFGLVAPRALRDPAAAPMIRTPSPAEERM
ncbi:MFS transporter [Dongia sp.]|uniref:MFS transporter n=1 Tax=Dongia sp. TaxID=1977262 RepID=UPI0037528131